MKKMLSFLIVVLIALTGIACASACDVDNIAADDTSVMVYQDVNNVSDFDLKHCVEDNSTSQDEGNGTPVADEDDSGIAFVKNKTPAIINTAVVQNDNVLVYNLNFDLNCSGDVFFTVKSGNETCLDCAVTLTGPNSFNVNKFSSRPVTVPADDSVPYTITACYSGDANHYPTMLSQIIVVNSSITNAFVVNIQNEICTSLMHVI